MWMTTAGARFAASIPANRCLSSKTRIEPHVNNDFAHLTPSAADLLSESSEKRIRAIKSRRWVLYPRAKQALDHLSRLIDHPRGTRMPSVAVYGDSGMGKTMIMERFRDDNPPGFDPGTGRERTPVLAMEMVGKPGERRFYAELLALLGAPQSPRADHRPNGAGGAAAPESCRRPGACHRRGA